MVNRPHKPRENANQRVHPVSGTQPSSAENFRSQRLTRIVLWPASLIGLTWLFLWYFRWPLGVPGEWVWWRISWNEPDRFINLFLGLIAGLAYLVFVLAGARRIDHLSPARTTFWISGLLTAAFAWSFCIIELAPSSGRFGKAPFVLYYPASSGYFTIARHESPQVDEFLKSYLDRVRQGDVLHVGTHPPGLFLVFHTITAVVENAPLLRDLALATMPVSFHDACEIIKENGQNSPHPMNSNDAAILWLATLLVIIMAAGTTLPLYLLTRQFSSPRTAWFTAALWPLVPATIIFVPKSDAAFPFLSTILLMGIPWLCRARQHRPIWQLLIGGLLWGMLATIGMVQSLAFAPILLMCFLYGLAALLISSMHREDKQGQASIVSNALAGLAVLCGFLGAAIAFSTLTGANLWFIWWQNSINHSHFYEVSPRTTWLWFLIAPVELAFASGWPVFLRFLFSVRLPEPAHHQRPLDGLLQKLWQSFVDPSRSADGWRLAACCLVVWLWLWCSGKNSGETARLWIFLMPILLWAPILIKTDIGPTTQSTSTRSKADSLEPVSPTVWLVAQMIVCLLTVWRISGFDFGGGLFNE